VDPNNKPTAAMAWINEFMRSSPPSIGSTRQALGQLA
jgi:hypothetical protein